MLNILLFLIFIRPFISSLSFPYLNLVYSGILLFFLFIRLAYTIRKGTSLKPLLPFMLPLILFLLSLAVSLIFSPDKINGARQFYSHLSGLILFVTAVSLSSTDKARLIRAIAVAGLIVGLLAIYQYFFGFRHILDYIGKEKISDPFVLDYLSRRRVFFPFVTPNVLAGYLITVIPLALTFKDKAWLFIPLALALMLTKSLGALIAAFLALGFYFCLTGKISRRNIVLLAGVLAATGAILFIRSGSPQHTQPAFSTIMRLSYWKETLEAIKSSPLRGVGLGNLHLSQSRYTHNSYLQIWAETGIFGLLSLLWIIALSFIKGIKKPAVLSASAAFLIHNFIDFTFFLPEVSLIWWVILAAASG